MSAVRHVLVVGASAGGLGTLEALRRRGYTGAVTLLGAEAHPPYDRPPLSKQILRGEWEPQRARLRTPDALAALDATLHLDDPAVAFDATNRTVRTASGRHHHGDVVVLATGARPRRLPGHAPTAGTHVLRTLDDALALRADLVPGRRLVVVGDGVLGTEIAATARALDLDVTLAGPQLAPMRLQLGDSVAELLADLHAGRGVRLRLGAAVTGLRGDASRVTGVHLATGEVLPADVAVVAFGAAPAIEWLADSGLTLDDGVVCDSRCRAADGVYAVGDVARWHHETLGRPIRLEHRTNAAEQADAVAANILGADLPYTPVPYFWTDQFDARIQVYGSPVPDARLTVLDGDPTAGRFTAVYRLGEQPVAVLGWNMPKQARQQRQRLLPAPAAPAGTVLPAGAAAGVLRAPA